jgi:hypothetical protein
LRFTTAGVTDAGVVSRFTGKPVQPIYDEDLGKAWSWRSCLLSLVGALILGSQPTKWQKIRTKALAKITLNGFVMNVGLPRADGGL